MLTLVLMPLKAALLACIPFGDSTLPLVVQFP
jgi:hypothetical protein